MLENIKIKLNEGIKVNELDYLVVKELNKVEGRLFFIDEQIDDISNAVEFNKYTAMELIKEGGFYNVCPVIIYSNENDEIQKVELLSKEFNYPNKKIYYLYWNDLFLGFIQELSEHISYEPKSLIGLLKNIINEHPKDTYYYADGNMNGFSLDILDEFSIEGKLYPGQVYGTMVISDLILRVKYTDINIVELPDVYLEGLIDIGEEEEDEYFDVLFASYLGNMRLEEMTPYILKSIEAYESK